MSCNGSGLRELLKDRPYEGEDSAASAKRKADVEKWAALLAAGATQAQSNASSLGRAPDGWRSDVEELTPANLETRDPDALTPTQSARGPSPAATAAGADDPTPERLQVRVSIGELGELALILERSTEGVKIQISAQDHRILEMMAQEQDSLAAALSGIGNSIASLSFVPMDRVGIKLAQPRVASQTSKPQNDDSGSAQQATRSKRKSRGLNVIG
jgi:hypothetical protein